MTIITKEGECTIETDEGRSVVPRHSLPSYFADITKTYIYENEL